jgi:hypothetical protein
MITAGIILALESSIETKIPVLARGHALSQGRDHITLVDIPTIAHVVLSTASIERVTIFQLLISNNRKLSTP